MNNEKSKPRTRAEEIESQANLLAAPFLRSMVSREEAKQMCIEMAQWSDAQVDSLIKANREAVDAAKAFQDLLKESKVALEEATAFMYWIKSIGHHSYCQDHEVCNCIYGPASLWLSKWAKDEGGK